MKQRTTCQSTNYHDTTDYSGYLPWLQLLQSHDICIKTIMYQNNSKHFHQPTLWNNKTWTQEIQGGLLSKSKKQFSKIMFMLTWQFYLDQGLRKDILVKSPLFNDRKKTRPRGAHNSHPFFQTLAWEETFKAQHYEKKKLRKKSKTTKKQNEWSLKNK